tara:strand:- start:4293 stop:4553 length:261 start_codon:yes stop_codon:yes gene_type:complete
MITQTEWNKLPEDQKDEMSNEAFSFRQCQKCLNYIDLGGNNEDNAEGGYLDSFPFDCPDGDVDSYETKNTILVYATILFVGVVLKK